MPRRLLLLAAATGAFVLLVGVGVNARVDQHKGRPLDTQNIGVLGQGTTSSTGWAPVPNWGFSDGPAIQARGSLAATLSVTVSGAPVQFRIVLEDVQHGFKERAMKPGRAVFDPGAAAGSFSSTFVLPLSKGPHTVNIFWRSPTGASVIIRNGSVVLQYASSR